MLTVLRLAGYRTRVVEAFLEQWVLGEWSQHLGNGRVRHTRSLFPGVEDQRLRQQLLLNPRSFSALVELDQLFVGVELFGQVFFLLGHGFDFLHLGFEVSHLLDFTLEDQRV